MSFLQRLRDSQTPLLDWIPLTDIEQLNDIDRLSQEKPVVIFKHSTTCGISASAKYRLQADWDELPEDIQFYFLDLLAYRHISNEVASRYGVRHESPQVLVIKDGQASFNTSHHRISAGRLSEVL